MRILAQWYMHFHIIYCTGQSSSVVNSSSVTRRTNSRTPTVSPPRDSHEVGRLLENKPFLYQEDFNIEPGIFVDSYPL